MTLRNSRRILVSTCLGLSLLSLTLFVMETRTAASKNAASASVPVGNMKTEPSLRRTLSHAFQQPQQAEKTTEQVQKNILVLKGLPQSQLIPVMNFFTTSLGVKCTYCHVNKDGVWAFDSDEKPEKKSAREMITMVLNINKTNFRGNTDVSCFTCHRGRTQPTAVPQFPLPEPPPRPERPAPGAAAQPREPVPTADQILDKYTAALGNAAAIDKLTSRAMKGTLLASNGATAGYEGYQVMPSRVYVVLNTPRGLIERGFNGTVGWEKSQQGIRELEGDLLAYLLRYPGPVVGGAKLKGMFTRLGFGGKDKIDGRDVLVLRGTTADNKRERLFFDAETGLLVRRVLLTPTMVGVIPEQVDYDDYRDVDGVKMPFTMKVSALDQNYSGTLKLTEIKINVPVDEAKFNKPAAPPSQPKP